MGLGNGRRPHRAEDRGGGEHGAQSAAHIHESVEHAQHFSFLTVCPPECTEKLPVICNDPPGLDRAQFHEQFNGALIIFFNGYL